MGLPRGYASIESAAGKVLLGKTPGSHVKVGEGDDALDMTIVAIGKPDAPAPVPVVDAIPAVEA